MGAQEEVTQWDFLTSHKKSAFLMSHAEWDDLKYAIAMKAKRKMWQQSDEQYQANPQQPTVIHRVDLGRDGGIVRIFTWGCEPPLRNYNAAPLNKNPQMLPVGDDLIYDSVDDLPEWMQQKLALLSGIDCSKPTEELEGIGRRVSDHVYWVYPSDEERLEKK